MANKNPISQPRFDSRIYKLTYPLQGGRNPGQGTLKHGFMVWEKPIPGYSGLAKIHFLYNPSTVEADYPISDSTAQAVLNFPNPGDKADLRVPLSQTASWSVLYDRTYELWGSYHSDGKPREHIGKDKNNPSVVGVLADIIQFQQFTGMMVGFSPGTASVSGAPDSSFAGHQGIMQIVPSYVYFSDQFNLSFYGYISEWDVQVTHWTNFMVPMRCVINVSFTMLPPPQNRAQPNTTKDNNWLITQPKLHVLNNLGGPQTGVSGR